MSKGTSSAEAMLGSEKSSLMLLSYTCLEASVSYFIREENFEYL